LKVDRGLVIHLPAIALVFEIDGVNLGMVGPCGAVGVAGRKFQREALVGNRKRALKLPIGLGKVGALALFVLPGDNSAGVPAGWVGDLGLDVFVVLIVSFTRRADLGHLVVLDGVLVPGRVDAPGMEGKNLGILVEPDNGIGVIPALGAQNLDHPADVLDRLTPGVDGVGLVVEQDDRLGRFGQRGQRLLRGGLDPVGNGAG